ncbi:beta-lactamase family protein [Bacillus sp. WMMC1349]|uniref:serine hydrolase domain-containing protein n=1 Tax=Bacillus sp. WMMC1349 TaxID=2736254 RepID=UPI001557AFA7|nr:serine hydrolase domain-containing protein [Bacillus sp. WMMC1349]NPC90723.1 beta-lactamase family protein [Bacillus sp. WMMC1349]NPC91283.1 beta-lactamase family protein [Bacillus sp. WMMC1349]
MSRSYSTRTTKQKHKKIRRRLILTALFLACVAFYVIVPANLYQHQENHLQASEKPTKLEKKKKHQQKKQSSILTKNENKQVDQYLKSIGFSGTALIVDKGKIVTSKGYSYADRKNKVLNTTDTVFYIGSAQKSIIATAVLQLEEKGLLSVNDPVSTYIADFPNGSNITLYNLLTHTSGIKGHKETKGYISPENLMKDIKNRGVVNPPGIWKYKDSNYSVLAYIVSKLSGEPIDHYIDEHIFKPAGMKHAGFYQTFAKQARTSIGYKFSPLQKLSTPYMPDLSQLYGAGDMYMTAYDMYLFDKALFERTIISDVSFRKMFTPYRATYGMGFYIAYGNYSSHGVMPGYNILNNFSQTGKRYVILFSNIQNNIKSFGAVNNHIYGILNNGA